MLYVTKVINEIKHNFFSSILQFSFCLLHHHFYVYVFAKGNWPKASQLAKKQNKIIKQNISDGKLSTGIGLAVSRYLLQHSSQPCNLVVAARTRYPLEELKREFPGRVELVVGRFGDAPPSLSACPSSSTSSTSSSSSSSPASSVPFALEAEVVRTAQSKWGRLDGIVINHATLEPVGRVASDANVEGWQEAFNVNLFSAVALVRYNDLHLIKAI